MSAVTASSTEGTVVYVRLLNEGTDVWRPVEAERLSEATYRLSEAPVPEEEEWGFPPGQIVVVEHKGDGATLVAVAAAKDIDERSQAWALVG